MLPKKNRLTRKEISALKTGKNRVFQGQLFGLVFEKPKDQTGINGEKKYGLIISNKISKKATQRNKIKRLLYRAIKKGFFVKPGKFLFLAKKSSIKATVLDLEKEVEKFNNLI